MVSQAGINAKVSYGLGKAAKALGAPCGWYRHPGGGNPAVSPVSPAAYRGPLTAAFQVANTDFMIPRRARQAAAVGPVRHFRRHARRLPG